MAGTVGYETGDGVATLTLDRPGRLNAITPELADDLDAALARANGDGAVHAVRLRGAGRAFCAGVGGGTDLALCSDLIVCADDCRIGYPPARVWGSPTTAMWTYRLGLERSKRLLLTGDPIDGRTAVTWGLASEAVPAAEVEAAGLALARRVARLPASQLHAMKVLVNQAYEQMGLATTQLIGTLLDGAARHTPEGVAFSRAARDDVAEAVRRRDAPFGDYGQEPRSAG